MERRLIFDMSFRDCVRDELSIERFYHRLPRSNRRAGFEGFVTCRFDVPML